MNNAQMCYLFRGKAGVRFGSNSVMRPCPIQWPLCDVEITNLFRIFRRQPRLTLGARAKNDAALDDALRANRRSTLDNRRRRPARACTHKSTTLIAMSA